MIDREQTLNEEEFKEEVHGISEIVKAVADGKCLNLHPLNIIFSCNDVPRTADKINVRC
jgi:hypothetical protein